MQEWIGDIYFSPETEAKLRHEHDLTSDQVRLAVALGAHDTANWEDHPEYGERLVVTGSDEKGSLIAYLRPLDRLDGYWECLTAWRTE